ncbi:MAG: tetratricopeptide repeat protein [Aureispira sp.]|nr:tetratricopeptide repeat protein [Aureispira sp.]
MIKKHYLLLTILIFSTVLSAQPNCEAFKYYGDTTKCEACKKSMEISGHYQFSKEFQEILDESLAIDPTYDYAYRAKSVAYLKSGDFLTWKKLIDKAVEYNTIENLGYRGWCRYQFFRDYEGAIRDIEKLDSLVDYDIGYSANGDYHLNIAKALCYKALGQKKKAVEIIKKQLEVKVGLYDYLHLGVLYFELGDFDKAEEALDKQLKENKLTEAKYYLGLLSKELKEQEKALSYFREAKELYLKQYRLFDTYTHPYDKIYLEDIELEL